MAIHVLLSIAVAYSTTYGDEPGREYLEAMQRSEYESGVLQELLRQRLREEHLDEVALAAEVSAIDMQAEEAKLLELQPPGVRDAAAVPVGRQLEEYASRAVNMSRTSTRLRVKTFKKCWSPFNLSQAIISLLFVQKSQN